MEKFELHDAHVKQRDDQKSLEAPEEKISSDSEIERESIQIAAEKLALIRENFFDYGVRFATVQELEDIIESKTFKRREIFVPKLDRFDDLRLPSGAGGKYEFKKPLAFDEYVKNQGNGGSWINTAWMQTQWKPSLGQINAHELLINLVKYSHRGTQNEKAADNRDEVLIRFRNRILKLATANKKQKPMHFSEEHEDKHTSWLNVMKSLMELKALLTKNGKRASAEGLKELYEESKLEGATDTEELKKLADLLKDTITPLKDARSFETRKAVSFENLLILSELIDNPEYIQQQGNLRKVIDALSNSLITTTPPYQLALVFSTKNVSEDSTYRDSWRLLKDEGSNQANGLLAAIAVISDKNLLSKINEVSKRGGKFSCPVFSAEGNVAFPKK